MKCKICDKQYNDFPPSGPWRKGGLCKECKFKVKIDMPTQGGNFSLKQEPQGEGSQ